MQNVGNSFLKKQTTSVTKKGYNFTKRKEDTNNLEANATEQVEL